MIQFPIFLSVVMVTRNSASELEAKLRDATAAIGPIVSDYELIVVDNGSTDDSLLLLESLAKDRTLPNLQVYALTKEVDFDTAAWAGLENALGDFIALLDPISDDIRFLPSMLEHSVSGLDAVFATNDFKPPQSLAYRLCFSIFSALYVQFHGVDLLNEAPSYRLLSKRVVNFILQHSAPALTYRHLPATSGFAKKNLHYSNKPSTKRKRRLFDSIDRGMRMLVSTTRGPMRLVTALSLFGAVSNLVYSVYVIAIAFFKQNVAPGWVTLSLQQSGMFFLLSLVLLVLGEYTLHMAQLSNGGPPYHIAREFTSSLITRRQKLNVEEAEPAPQVGAREHKVRTNA